MGQRRTIEIPFAGGLDERFSKKVLPQGLLRTLHNQHLDQVGRVVRRQGRWAAGTDADVIGSDATPRAVFAQQGDLSMLTPRRQYTRRLGDWVDVGPAQTIVALNATPVKTLDVPAAPYVPVSWTDARRVRRGVDECCSAAVACSTDGSLSGSYVLVAQRSDLDLGSAYSLWGWVTLMGYRYWEDDYGLPHWDEVLRKTITAHYASQVRVWTCGANVLCGFITDEGGSPKTWGMVLERWEPRTSLMTVTETTLYTGILEDYPPTCWDVAYGGYYEGGKYQYALAAGVGIGAASLKVLVLDEDNVTVHSATDDAASGVPWNVVAVCWNGITSVQVYGSYSYPADSHHHVHNHTVHGVYVSTTDLGDTSVTMGVPRSATLAVPADDGTHIRVWVTFEVTQVLGTVSQDWYWFTLAHTAPYAAADSGYLHAPGRMVSKPFSWGSAQAVWIRTSNEDLTDRSYVCCRVVADTNTVEQFCPVAVASPNQAGTVFTNEILSEVSAPTPGVMGEPARWFWTAPETYAGSTSVAAPDMAPRLHAWGILDALPDPVVVDGPQVFSCEGVPAVWGPGGRQEIQPVMGPGILHYLADTGAGALADGSYTWRAVYRVVRPDGTVVRSKPGPSCTGTMTGGPGHARLGLRPPVCTCVAAGTDAAPAIFVDVYRTTVNTGTIWYFVGSTTIMPDAPYAEYEFHDGLADADITDNESLYTGFTDEIPCAGIPSFSTMRAHGARIFGAHGRRLWYSTQRASNIGPYFGAGAYQECEAEITALASTEMGLIVFTRSSTWLLYGDGPGPNLQPFWPPLRLLSRDVGCVSQCSVLEWRDGVFFQSDRGLEVLRKTGQIEHWHDRTKKFAEDYPIVRRVLELHTQNEIWWLMASAGAWPGDSATTSCISRWLVWNYDIDAWRTEDAVGMCDAAAPVEENGQVLYEVTRTGANSLAGWQSWKTWAGWYDSDYLGANPAYPTRTLRTGTIRPAGIGGWGRLRRLRVYGDPPEATYGIGAKVTVTVRQHSEADAEVSSAHVIYVPEPAANATAENVLLEIAPTNQLCGEFDVEVKEEEVTGYCSLFLSADCGATVNVDLAAIYAGNTMDGYTLALGTRFLLTGQTNGIQNGIWVVGASPGGGQPNAVTRASDYPAGADTDDLLPVYVTGGTSNSGAWPCTLGGIVGTDSLRFTKVSAGGMSGQGTAWMAISFDWEDLANRPRTTTLLRA